MSDTKRTEPFVLDVEGIAIAGQFYLPTAAPPYPVVCLCHGIPSGAPPDPEDGGYPLLAEKICKHGFAVVIFNFRGTGESGGNFDILGWTRDLRGVIDYLHGLSQIDNSRIVLFGFSGGAAVSVYVAARDSRVLSVAACACPAQFDSLLGSYEPHRFVEHFRSIGTIRDEGFPRSADTWAAGFHRVKPIDYVNQISPRPLLILHGRDDETVALSHAHRLYEHAGDPKQLVVLGGAGHRMRQDERVLNSFLEWIKSLDHM